MKRTNRLKALLITGLIGLCGPALFAGSPVSLKEKEPSKPTQQLHSWCEIRGYYDVVYDSDGNSVHICRMVSTDFCYSVPCGFGMPLGNKPPVKSPVPPGVQIEEGQSFFAYYDRDNKLKVVFTDKLSSEVTVDTDGNEVVSVTIGQ